VAVDRTELKRLKRIYLHQGRYGSRRSDCRAYPIVTIGTGSFAFEAWPQIVNEAPNICYMSGGQVKVPVMFHALVGIRMFGAAQHSARPQAMLMQAAGLQVIAPSVASDVKGLLHAVKESERPTFWVDHPLLFDEKWPDEGSEHLPLGKAPLFAGAGM
jgi:pyruvate dehydrogenase E1 component beta subunit